MRPYEILASECLIKANIVDLYRDTILLPNGKTTTREVVRRGRAAAVIAALHSGEILFVRQYRHATGDFQLEIPAGMLEEGEDPAAGAARELEEETGYRPGKIRELFSFYSCIGFCDEVLHLFLAEDLTSGTPNPDEDEFVVVETYPKEEALRKVLSGEIRDAKTIAGVLYMCQEIHG
ncbi:MAG: NUDIX hydrolase [Clostridiales bacterium]|jgi:ADP-ribose pyrophosphatase|nr:NUDIX hydrolase [Clostridiales bacterium]